MKRSQMFFGLAFIMVIVGVILLFTSRENDEITPSEARQNLQKGKYDFIVDVRTDKEWDEGHLPNTIHIPIGSLVQELPEKIPNTNSRILFVCKKGVRASGVVTIAHKLGYKNVQAMIGNYKELDN